MLSEYNSTLRLKDKICEKFSFLKDIHNLFYFTLSLIGVGFLFFGFALITQQFTTPYSGDFSQQAYQLYYNFYDDWWTFFKTGHFPMYDSNTFLGADNIASNTYYGLFSPFTFPILFFPRNMIPQAMALISIARLTVGGLLFRIYLKYLGVSERNARFVSIAYAFTGWMAYYLWFNPFYEVLTFFPLILFGIEKILKERKPFFVILGFFLLSISNYFFLLSIGIFSVCYAGFRFFQTLKTRNAKENLLVFVYGFFGFLFGIGLSMFCVYPALIASFNINRADNANYLNSLSNALRDQDYSTFFKIFFTCWNANIVNYGSSYEAYDFGFLYPLCSYFFPTVSDRFTNILHYRYFENNGSSIFLYTPMMLLLGVSIFNSAKDKKVSHFIAIAILISCLFIPFFYFLCGAFITAYGRWEIVISISALTYIALNLDKIKETPRVVIIVSGILCSIMMVTTFLLANKYIAEHENFLPMGDMIILVIYQLVLTAIETGLFAGFWKKKYLHIFFNSFLVAEICVVGTLVANIHSLQNIRTSVGGGYNNIPTETEVIRNINENDNSYFRIQASMCYEGNTNLGMIENFNGVSTFHSFYNNEIDDFLRFSQIMMNDTAWNGTAFTKRSNLDEFLGVKYYVAKESDTTFTYTKNGTKTKVTFSPNIPLGYERIDDENDNDGYRVYKNKYQINLATSYDVLYYKNECAGSNYNSFYPYYSGSGFVIRNEETYFKGAILNNDDVNEIKYQYGDVFSYYTSAPNTTNAKLAGTKIKGVFVNEDRKYFDPLNPDRDIKDDCLIDPNTSDAPVNRYQIVFEPGSGSYFPLGAEGTYFMFDYPVRVSSGSNYAATVYLIGEDEEGNSKVITFDNGRNSSRSSGRSMRGLYSKEKVKRIIVCCDGDSYMANVNSTKLYYEYFEDCIARYQQAIANGVNDVTYNVNDFTFTTNYSSPRFVVTQLAYTGSNGWRVVAIDANGNRTNLKVYNSMGGFAGFVAPSGAIKYEMSYVSPSFKEGLIISLISLFGSCVIVSAGYVITKIKRKEN